MKKNLYLLLSFLVVSAFSIKGYSQIMTTVAGNGVTGYTGDGGPATAAHIKPPWSVVSDGVGGVFLGGDWWSSTSYGPVRRVNSAGIITTYAGTGTLGFSGDGGPATAANIFGPCDVASD